MITTPGVTYRMFQALSKKKININGYFNIRNKNICFNK